MNMANQLPRPTPVAMEPQTFDNSGIIPDVLTPTGQQLTVSGWGACSPDLIGDARNIVAIMTYVLGFEVANAAAGTAMTIPAGAGSSTLFSAGPGQTSGYASFGMPTNPAAAVAIPEAYSSTYKDGSTSANLTCQRVDFGVFITARSIFQYLGATGGEAFLTEFDNQSPYPEQLLEATAHNAVLTFTSTLFNCTYVGRTLADTPGFGGLVGGSKPSIGRFTSMQYLPFNAVVISGGQNAGDQVRVGATMSQAISIANNAMIPTPAPRATAPVTEARAVVSYTVHRVGATVSVTIPGLCGPTFPPA